MTEQAMAVMRARNRAFRWPKGVSGNPTGQEREERPAFNPRDHSPEELDLIERALRLMVGPRDQRQAGC